MSFSIRRLIALALLMTACGPTRPPPGPVPAPSANHPVPSSLHGYRLTRTEEIPAHEGGGHYYRFSDGSRILLSVFLYPIPADVQLGDSVDWVLAEGAKFAHVFPIHVERGRYDTYRMAFAHPEPVVIGSDTIAGYVAAAVTRSRGSVAVQLQYVYLLDGRFVKVRATLPQDQWQQAPVPDFVHDVVRYIFARQRSP